MDFKTEQMLEVVRRSGMYYDTPYDMVKFKELLPHDEKVREEVRNVVAAEKNFMLNGKVEVMVNIALFRLLNFNILSLIAQNFKETKKEIRSVSEAIRCDVLKDFFLKYDFLDICHGRSSSYVYIGATQQMYFDYLKSIDKMRVIQHYCSFVEKGPGLSDLSEMSDMGPTDFAFYFKKQFPQYMEIIEQLDPKKHLVIPGDGPGTASVASIIQGRSYYSCEPNRVGDEARSLGIITSGASAQTMPVFDNSILLLFNVAAYFDVRPMIEMYDLVVLVDDRRGFVGQDLMDVVPGTYGSVYVKGLSLNLNQFGFRLAYSDKLVKNICKDKNIEVSDIRTLSYVKSVTDKIVTQDEELISMGVVKGEGKKVSLVDREGSLNLKTKNNVSNLKNGRPGNTKLVYGYINEVDHSPISCLGDYDFILYNPPPYEMENVIYKYEVWEGYYLAYIRRPEKVRYIFKDNHFKKVLLLGSLEKFDKEGKKLYMMIDEFDPYGVSRTVPTIVDLL